MSISRKLMMGAAGAGGAGLGIEEIFSTWLYTGNGSTQTITNGIDLAGEGGLVWTKDRSVGYSHVLVDTERGRAYNIKSNSTAGNTTAAPSDKDIVSFGSSGYSLGADWNGNFNTNGTTFASWTFRKAPGFFDVVTFTAGSSTNRRISHSLGSAPGFVVIKNYSGPTADSWYAYHRSLGRSSYLSLNTTAASATFSNAWGTSDPTSIDFGINETAFCQSGQSYVAYLFAHDAGGFGDSGNESVIKCGSYTGTGSGSPQNIDLGWEAQWVMVRGATWTENWYMYDNMRGLPVSGTSALLWANLSNAEGGASGIYATSTGFNTGSFANGNGQTYIYIAIRRGPMKTPTDATKVFSANVGAATGTVITTNFPVDLAVSHYKPGSDSVYWFDRVRGVNSPGVNNSQPVLRSVSTAAESLALNGTSSWDNTSYKIDGYIGGTSYIHWTFRRAPGFFDVVAYAGTGVARTVSHNLGVAPELMIVKQRNTTSNWRIYSSSEGATKYKSFNNPLYFNTTSDTWNNTAPTSSVFTVGTNSEVNGSGGTFVAYLFGSVSGVSKVGSYTGTGTTLNIDCGFTAGARFVLITRAGGVNGDWYIWDTARGIVSGNDPYLLLNSTASEVTSTDYIDPLSSGFQISSTAPAAINANGGSYIFLAIA